MDSKQLMMKLGKIYQNGKAPDLETEIRLSGLKINFTNGCAVISYRFNYRNYPHQIKFVASFVKGGLLLCDDGLLLPRLRFSNVNERGQSIVDANGEGVDTVSSRLLTPTSKLLMMKADIKDPDDYDKDFETLGRLIRGMYIVYRMFICWYKGLS